MMASKCALKRANCALWLKIVKRKWRLHDNGLNGLNLAASLSLLLPFFCTHLATPRAIYIARETRGLSCNVVDAALVVGRQLSEEEGKKEEEEVGAGERDKSNA